MIIFKRIVTNAWVAGLTDLIVYGNQEGMFGA